MGRRAKFTEQGILDAALVVVAEDGPEALTVARLSQALGAPSGSIYHRFASLDLLRATLWLRTITAFQQGFLAALAQPDPDVAAAGAARHVVEWAREHPGEARLMLVYRREDLGAAWPAALGDRLAHLNDEVGAALREHAYVRWGQVSDADVARVTLALVDLPYAAGRRYLLAGEVPPVHVDDLVEVTALFLLRRLTHPADGDC